MGNPILYSQPFHLNNLRTIYILHTVARYRTLFPPYYMNLKPFLGGRIAIAFTSSLSAPNLSACAGDLNT